MTQSTEGFAEDDSDRPTPTRPGDPAPVRRSDPLEGALCVACPDEVEACATAAVPMCDTCFDRTVPEDPPCEASDKQPTNEGAMGPFHTPTPPQRVQAALERSLYAHEQDFSDDHDAAIEHGHAVLNEITRNRIGRVNHPAVKDGVSRATG